ncbi:bifunctional precorrin-2 dehydrogenase/sirohydrochlorin ferrochelatase [Ammoniphilus sp. CFH 90114]|uniref:precorrin-2 dehydrogenase/sirohydrochlorin ferrochelatase family protein n=1 Tax=Ammoniphilus sp. CFH 90114 TaxID=2493665 RepID=UPI00100E600D|nr:bifunctional precorrin-2 dehydrogenase/sirohydrochlorin ferrochelatase [Ammoniphilus sp. CFH 90114]RXT07806.1 bifunctional precorrin-2 dehydrogenase/sirohydrochlorin ferrochelatase [Ammoniphilus sp. CFH 90114]
MKNYPMMMKLTGQRLVVIGGGRVAERKIRGFVNTGAEITVISPECTDSIKSWAALGKLKYIAREFQEEDLHGASFIIAATNDPEVNVQIYQAKRAYQWINVVDRPDLCTFTVPSLVTRGDLQIAISTGGKSPGLSRKMRKQMESWIGQEYGEYLEFLGQQRKEILGLDLLPDVKRSLLTAMLDDRFLQWTKEGNLETRSKEAARLMSQAIQTSRGSLQ